MEKAGNNNKKVWKVINEMSCGKLKTNNIQNITITNKNKETVTDNQGKADTSNNYFINLGSEMAAKFEKIDLPNNILRHREIQPSIFSGPGTGERFSFYRVYF